VLQITAQHGGTPYEITLPRVPWLREQSYCDAQSIQPVGLHEFVRKVGSFEASMMAAARMALKRRVHQ
jgi:hypothetical protein